MDATGTVSTEYCQCLHVRAQRVRPFWLSGSLPVFCGMHRQPFLIHTKHLEAAVALHDHQYAICANRSTAYPCFVMATSGHTEF